MAQKILNFITSRSERSRKGIAAVTVGLAGLMLFFAWTAGVSARLPLLGSELDASNEITLAQAAPSQTNSDEMPAPATAQTAASPLKGLMDSFQDLSRLFRGEYPDASAQTNQATSDPARPIDDLFDKVADETPATDATTTPHEDLPPAEELPGL